MTPLRALVVVLAGFGGGALTAVVGAGSLASLPVLLAIGLPPVTANVTSAVGVVPGSAAGVYAYRHQLPGLRRLLVPMLLPTVLGGVAGALLLLVLPASTFETLLPGLLLMAAVLVALQPRIARAVARRQARVTATVIRADSGTSAADEPSADADAERDRGPTAGPVVLSLGVLVAVYGGYFGAAVSVLYLAMLGSIVGGLQASNGAKNTLTGLSCGAACVVFVLRAHPDWAAVGLLAIGSTVGGLLAGRYGQRLPDSVLRVALIVIAVVTAAVEATR